MRDISLDEYGEEVYELLNLYHEEEIEGTSIREMDQEELFSYAELRLRIAQLQALQTISDDLKELISAVRVAGSNVEGVESQLSKSADTIVLGMPV